MHNNDLFINILSELKNIDNIVGLIKNYKGIYFSNKNEKESEESNILLDKLFNKMQGNYGYDKYKKISKLLTKENGFDLPYDYIFTSFLKRAPLSYLKNTYTAEDDELAIEIYNNGLIWKILADPKHDLNRSDYEKLKYVDFNILNEKNETFLFNLSTIAKIKIYQDFINKPLLLLKNDENFNFIDKLVDNAEKNDTKIDNAFSDYIKEYPQYGISNVKTIHSLIKANIHHNPFFEIMNGLDKKVFKSLQESDFRDLCNMLTNAYEEKSPSQYNDSFKRKMFYYFKNVEFEKKNIIVNKEYLSEIFFLTDKIIHKGDIALFLFNACSELNRKEWFSEIIKEWINRAIEKNENRKEISRTILAFINNNKIENIERFVEDNKENLITLLSESKITCSLFKELIKVKGKLSAELFFTGILNFNIDENMAELFYQYSGKEIAGAKKMIGEKSQHREELIFGDKGKLMSNKLTALIYQNKILKELIEDPIIPAKIIRI